MKKTLLFVTVIVACSACDNEPSSLGPPVQPGESVEKIDSEDLVKFSKLRKEAQSAELAVERARKFTEGTVDKAGYQRKVADMTKEFNSHTTPRQRAFAALMEEIRTELPSNVNPDNIDVYLKNDEIAFAMPGVEIREMRTLRKYDKNGLLKAEKLGILQEQVPRDVKPPQVILPSTRGFSSTSRHSDGRYSWRNGKLGRVRIYWQKDWINETGRWNENPDWMVYSAWTRAEAYAPRWWQAKRFIYDIDTINGISSGSTHNHIQDNGYTVYSAPSGCSTVEVGGSWGGFGMAVPIELCARTSLKGDRVGGKHVEFRNSLDWLGRPIIQEQDFAAGYSQEVKTKSNGGMYWWDYGDACFGTVKGGFPTGSILGCDEEVVQ